ncbi:MAG: hypothetical protein AABN95_27295, partial [Acidobacteriota bacterium]
DWADEFHQVWVNDPTGKKVTEMTIEQSVDQGDFVLARKFKIVSEVSRCLDISLVILYNRFHSRKGGMIGFEPRRSASASG